MGICLSCRRSKAARFKSLLFPTIPSSQFHTVRLLDKQTICEHISSSVSPLHVSDHSHSTNTNLGLSICLERKDGAPMANTISNMKMTNPIKGLVSKRRKRYIAEGFNLDLTYINDNLIAMGFPAEKLEGVYRNHIDDVVKFLDSKHKDHYKIYNLCSERSYDCSKFHKRVATYPFDDHNPPNMELIQPFCADVHEWLTADNRNVAAVHCKAGKGRTGTMVCCYMLHSKKFASADEALNHYGQMRTHDKKGVTIPSQRRYVNYYATLVKENLTYSKVILFIKEIHIEPLPNFNSGQGTLQFCICQSNIKLYSSPVYDIKKDLNSFKISLDQCIPISGDVKLEFSNKPLLRKKEKLFHFWFNTFFVRDELPNSDSENGDGRALSFDNQAQSAHYQPSRRQRSASQPNINVENKSLILTLHKHEIDDAHKDKQNKIYSPDFRVSLVLHRVPSPSGARDWLPEGPRPLPLPQDTPSESSEAENSDDDSNEEDGWDSVECKDPRGVGYRLLSETELAQDPSEILTA